ncbi:MAG TPA: hypothetical protein VFA48_00045, partial [Gammaproteobacteria bacterium]|nr:hypothetical protein [Gammaproteobacteria bacterium]
MAATRSGMLPATEIAYDGHRCNQWFVGHSQAEWPGDIYVRGSQTDPFRAEKMGVTGPIEVIPNGVDHGRFAPRSKEEAGAFRRRQGLGEYFLCLGNMYHHKSIPALIRAHDRSRTRSLFSSRTSKGLSGTWIWICRAGGSGRPVIVKWPVSRLLRIFNDGGSVGLQVQSE